MVEEASLLRMPSSILCFSSVAFFLSNHACRLGLALPAEPVDVPESGIIISRMDMCQTSVAWHPQQYFLSICS